MCLRQDKEKYKQPVNPIKKGRIYERAYETLNKRLPLPFIQKKLFPHSMGEQFPFY